MRVPALQIQVENVNKSDEGKEIVDKRNEGDGESGVVTG